MIQRVFFLLSYVILLSSCASERLTYLQEEIDSLKTGQVYKENKTKYLLKPDDVLDIYFSTSNEELADIFRGRRGSSGNQTGGQGGGQKGRSFYFTGYSVTDSGYVEIPNLGKIHVVGLNIRQCEQRIQKRLDKYYKGVRAEVKLVSFKVTFMGEVNSTGPQYFYQEQVNLIEALSIAGGVSNYADLREILILRNTGDGRKTLKVDLTDRDILASEDFFLKPKDMVYVKPIPTRNFRIDVENYFFYISTLTSTISTLLLILNLNN